MDADSVVAAQAREIHALKAENRLLKQQLNLIRYEIFGATLVRSTPRPFGLSPTDHRVCRLLALHGEVTYQMLAGILTGNSNQPGVHICKIRKRLPPEIRIDAIRTVGYRVAEGLDILRKAYDIEPKETQA